MVAGEPRPWRTSSAASDSTANASLPSIAHSYSGYAFFTAAAAVMPFAALALVGLKRPKLAIALARMRSMTASRAACDTRPLHHPMEICTESSKNYTPATAHPPPKTMTLNRPDSWRVRTWTAAFARGTSQPTSSAHSSRSPWCLRACSSRALQGSVALGGALTAALLSFESSYLRKTVKADKRSDKRSDSNRSSNLWSFPCPCF